MKWISVVDKPIPTDLFVVVTDGKSIALPGHISLFSDPKITYYKDKVAYNNEPLSKAIAWCLISDLLKEKEVNETRDKNNPQQVSTETISAIPL